MKIDDKGTVMATYSNGQSQAAGQVALADFRNVQGLRPSANGTWAIPSGLVVDGTYSFTAKTLSSNGVRSAAVGPLVITVDTSAPVAPAITGFSPDTGVVGDRLTGKSDIVISGTAEANSIVTIYDRGVPVAIGNADAFGNFSIEVTLLTDGTHNFTTKATDGAGNIGPVSNTLSVKIDTAAPAAPVINTIGSDTGVQGDKLTADNTLTVAGTAEPGSVVSVIVDGQPVGTVVADANGAWTFTTLPLGDGNHSITATATDAAGNTGPQAAPASMAIDTTFPAIPSITGIGPDTGVQGDGLTSATALTVTGNAEPGSTVTLYADGVVVGTATANAQGVFSIPTGTLTSGAHTFVTTATDAAGNTSQPSAQAGMTIDNTAPSAPVITTLGTDTGAQGDGKTSDNTLTATGTAEPGSLVKVSSPNSRT